jgi:hypothetical protein
VTLLYLNSGLPAAAAAAAEPPPPPRTAATQARGKKYAARIVFRVQTAATGTRENDQKVDVTKRGKEVRKQHGRRGRSEETAQATRNKSEETAQMMEIQK